MGHKILSEFVILLAQRLGLKTIGGPIAPTAETGAWGDRDGERERENRSTKKTLIMQFFDN